MGTIEVCKARPRTLLWYVTMTILMFMYIFQIDFSAFGLSPQITSTRVVVLVFYLIGLFGLGTIHGRRIRTGLGLLYKKLTRFNIFLFFYMLLLYFAIGVKEGTPMFVIIINFFLLQIIPCAIFYKYFQTIDELLRVVLYVCALQTVIIWFCITRPEIGVMIDALFNQLGDYSSAREGYAGGIGCIAAPGYIRYFLGQLACFYFIVKSEQNKPLYLIIYLLFSLTGSMIARTGLIGSLIGIIILLFYLASQRGNKKLILSILLVSMVSMFVFDSVYSSSDASNFFGKRFYRMTTLFEESKTASSLSEIHFFDVYFNDEGTIIPQLSDKTLVGTGVPSGESGNDVRVNVDGEYLRLYVAFGLPLAIFFYFYLYWNMFFYTYKQKEKRVKFTMIFFVAFSFVAVFKEWTFYATPYILFFELMVALPTSEVYREKLRSSSNSK